MMGLNWMTSCGLDRDHAVVFYGYDWIRECRKLAVCGVAPRKVWSFSWPSKPHCKNCERKLRKMEGTKR